MLVNIKYYCTLRVYFWKHWCYRLIAGKILMKQKNWRFGMRKFLMALALLLLPVLGMASVSPASAAAPSGLTLLDKLSTAQSGVEQAQYKRRYHRRHYHPRYRYYPRRYRCYNVCVRRNYNGYCTRTVRRCRY